MKMTKRIAAMAACAVMTVTSMVGMNASAATDDHGNTMATASLFSAASSSISGKIDYAGDIDFFKYTATSSGIRHFYTTGSTDTYGYVYDSSGKLLTSGDNGGSNKNFRIGCELTSGQTYYVAVCAKERAYGTSYSLSTDINPLNVTHLSQVDSRWSSVMLGTTSGNPTIGKSGCALTSFTMVVNFLKGTSYTPTNVNTTMGYDAYAYDSNGKAVGFMWSTAKTKFSLSDCDTSRTKKQAIQDIADGKPVIIGIYKSDGNTHFLVAVNYLNGHFMVKDAGKSSSGTFNLDTAYPGSSIYRYVTYTK